MTKIIVTKTESEEAVIKKVEENEDSQITLVIPRESLFGGEVKNFELLKEAATELDKEVIIESVDANVLALAEANGFSALHPLFRSGKAGHVSDILPAKTAKSSRAKKGKAKDMPPARKVPKGPVLLHEMEQQIHGVEEEVHEIEKVVREEDVSRQAKMAPVHVEARESGTGKRGGKKLFAVLVFIAVLGAIYLGGERLFARAEITIQLKNTPWQDVSNLTASTNATGVSASVIPAQIFSQTKTDQEFFQASGKSTVSEKAKGKITVYNAYSSQPQTLVATTRFQSPDGKIVRLVNQIIVPGAKITDGKIIPSSIATDVIADKPGADYNIGPLPKLTVPGFTGSPKYDGFYGALEAQLSRGFVGVRATPTASDLASAKEKTTQVLKSIFGSGLFDGAPSDFTILSGAKTTTIGRLVVDTSVNDQGKFSILGEAKMSTIGFRDDDVKGWLLLKAQKADPAASFRSVDLSYANPQPDFGRGTLKLTVTSNGFTTPSFDAEVFRTSVLGKSAADVRALILKIPQLADGKLSFLPFWLGTVPTDPSRVKVTIE